MKFLRSLLGGLFSWVEANQIIAITENRKKLFDHLRSGKMGKIEGRDHGNDNSERDEIPLPFSLANCGFKDEEKPDDFYCGHDSDLANDDLSVADSDTTKFPRAVKHPVNGFWCWECAPGEYYSVPHDYQPEHKVGDDWKPGSRDVKDWLRKSLDHPM